MKTLKWISLFFILSLMLNCSSDDDGSTPEPEPTVEELLTTDTWYLESTTRYVADECDKETNYRFVTSGVYFNEAYYTNSSEECAEDFSVSFNWELLSDTELRFFPDDESWEEVWTIESITADELIIVDFSDDTYIYDKNPGDG